MGLLQLNVNADDISALLDNLGEPVLVNEVANEIRMLLSADDRKLHA
jgi:hypothetical protein